MFMFSRSYFAVVDVLLLLWLRVALCVTAMSVAGTLRGSATMPQRANEVYGYWPVQGAAISTHS